MPSCPRRTRRKPSRKNIQPKEAAIVPVMRAEAAEDDDDEGIEARDEVEAGRGEEADVVGVDAAAYAGDEGADDEGQELVLRDVDAHSSGRYLVLADGEGGPPRAGSYEVADDDDDRDEEDEGPGPVRELGYAEHAAPALHLLEGEDRVRVDEEGLHDDREAQGRYPEVVGAEA